jgi:hypothetical protein
MTETEWIKCKDPTEMLNLIERRSPVSQRKLRLFSVACCRRIWPVIPDDEARSYVEVAERFADNRATNEELIAAEQEAQAIGSQDQYAAARRACYHVCCDPVEARQVSWEALRAVSKHLQLTPQVFDVPAMWARARPGGSESHRRESCPSEELEQCGLVRDVFGNPFRAIPFRRHWCTDTALTLARTVYESREFSAMPILADALQDAGCDNDDILNHCRSDNPHVRGCWVVDLVLGKE